MKKLNLICLLIFIFLASCGQGSRIITVSPEGQPNSAIQQQQAEGTLEGDLARLDQWKLELQEQGLIFYQEDQYVDWRVREHHLKTKEILEKFIQLSDDFFYRHSSNRNLDESRVNLIMFDKVGAERALVRVDEILETSLSATP